MPEAEHAEAMVTVTATRTSSAADTRDRVDELDWDQLRAELDERGFAITQPLLSAPECEELSDLFDSGRFRSTIDMARHRFGDGRYRYFDRPLPDTIDALRTSFYRHLAPIARAALRQGVSTVTAGSRTALGVIFHDAT
jgi:hypothetical protein